MTIIRPAIAIVCLGMFSAASSVCGQGQNAYLAQVSYGVLLEIPTGSYPARERFTFSDIAQTIITPSPLAAAEAGIDKTLTFGNVSASIHAQGHAEVSVLRASLQGAYYNDFSSAINGIVSGSVTAMWQDTWVMNVPNLAPGELVETNGALKLTGFMGTDATAQNTTGTWDARTNVGLTLEGPILPNPLRFSLPPPIYRGYFAYSSSESEGGLETQIPHPALIPVSVVVRNGEALTFQIKMTLSGTATARDSFPTGPGFASAYFNADYSNTMAWNGITSVTNYATRMPIVDWTLSSASGFDYSQPYSEVPEPSLLSLLSIGLSLSLGWGWRRRLEPQLTC